MEDKTNTESQIDSLVPNALEYYDKTREKYKKLFSRIKDYKLEVTEYDLERNKIIFLDDEGKEILRSEYEVIGIYNNIIQTFIWSWSIASLKKNAVYISRKILNYGLDLDKSYFLKSELITSRFRISDDIQLDLHIAIASYLAKKVAYNYKYYPDPNNPNSYVVYYIFLLNLDAD